MQTIVKGTVVLALTMLLSLSTFAQRTTGSLKGQITDPNGAVLVGAKVTATDQSTSVFQSTVTTSSGIFIFPTLLPGNYTLKAEGQGFHDSLRKDVPVSANGERVEDVTMTVGSASETVEVIAGAASVETSNSTVSNTFSSKEVIDIPTGSQNPLQLAIFAPNTTAQQGGIGGNGGSVGGQRPDTNSFSVDGVDDNNVGVTGNNSNVIQDAVAEFNLVTNQFSAEYANAGAGQFNIVTKTGTNNWHGSGEEYLQNRNLNALDNLTKSLVQSGGHVPRFDQNIAGATIGGPLQRDRWFIFGAFQYTFLHQEGNTTTVSVPTAVGQSLLTSMAADSQAQKLLAVIPTAPVQAQNCGSTNDQPCALTVNGAQVPYGTDVLVSPNFTRERDFHINSDYRLGKHQLGARYLYNHLTGIQIASTPQPQFNQPETQDARKLSLTDEWAVSSTFFNDLRLSYSKFLQVITTPTLYDNYNTIELRDLGGVIIGPSDTQRNLEDNYQILDNQTYAVGKHTLKWGVEVRHSIAPTFYLPRSHGDYVYNNIQELVNDQEPGNQGNTLRGAGSPIFSQNQNSIYWFAQDDFKMSPRLTLNLGLRYEYASNFASSKTQQLNALSSIPGVIDFHNPKTDDNDYGPRVGFAWDPTGAGKWAVRGGFGVAFGKVFGNLPQLALPPQLQIEENPTLVCGTFNPAPAWCTNGGSGFLSNGGLPSTYQLPSDATLARGLTQGLIADVKNPKTLNWSLGVQRELYRGGVLEARYLGTRGLRLPVQIRLNSEGAFSAGLTPLPTYLSATQVPASVNSPTSTLATFDSYNPQVLSKYGFLSNVTVHEPIGASTYHGGSLVFTQSLKSGLTVRANYTYAHTIDNSTAELFSTFLNPRRPEDAYNLRSDRGNSALDVRQKVAIAWTYAVPKVKADSRWMKSFLNGYELNGSFVAQTGQPITVLSPYDANDNFDVAGDRAIINPQGMGHTASDVNAVCNAGAGGATSIVAADPATGLFSSCGSGDDTNVVGYVAVDPKARYVATQVGAKSTAGRNGFLTPGFGVWNLSATKNTHFTESAYLQLRVELFNAFNHRNFTVAGPVTYSTVLAGQNAVSNPNYNVALPGGDFLNSKLFSGGSRQVQVVMKLIF